MFDSYMISGYAYVTADDEYEEENIEEFAEEEGRFMQIKAV